MALETSVPRPRRALLAAALGSLAGLLGSRLAKPNPVAAAAGDNMILGAANDSGTSQTTLTNSGLGAAFTLKTTNAAGGATGIFGWSSQTGSGATRGMYGRADGPNSDGVQAKSLAASAGTGAALRAIGGQNSGIVATTDVANGIVIAATNTSLATDYSAGSAIRGLTGGATVDDIHPGGLVWDAAGEFGGPIGVIGATNVLGTGVVGQGGTGGIGVEGTSTDSVGVRGTTSSGIGVYGGGTSGIGVRGVSTSGIGVSGDSTSNFGVYGTSGSSYAGYFAGNGRLDLTA